MEGIIYKIENKVNGKVYIGQTIQSLNKRLKKHKNDCNKYKSKFYNSVRKYGWDSFTIEIVDKINYDGSENSIRKLNNLEIFYINTFNSFRNGLNSTLGGSGSSGYKHSEESKKLMSNLQKGKFVGSNNPMFGTNRKQHMDKMCNINKIKTLYTFIHKDGMIEENITQFDMYNKHDLDHSHINKIVNGKSKSHKGWMLKKED